ncbi:Fatty acid-binding protein, brain [Daphnia magna]|uniref:Fatty acid-binding protein, brain n=1 Tax=Daphnia magna TaxID=35525 RepID=A0A0P5DWW0_9CRUS|nr:Fatty acid-binding protein, brain [Daphnia magna]
MQDHDQKRSAFMAQVVGKYYLVSQENFEEYLKAIGLSMAKRAVAISQVPRVDCQINDDEWTVRLRGISKDSDFTFRLGVQMKRVAADGRHVTNVFDLQESDKIKLIQKETWGNGHEAMIVHDFDGDDWTMTITFGDVTCVRHFRRE